MVKKSKDFWVVSYFSIKMSWGYAPGDKRKGVASNNYSSREDCWRKLQRKDCLCIYLLVIFLKRLKLHLLQPAEGCRFSWVHIVTRFSQLHPRKIVRPVFFRNLYDQLLFQERFSTSKADTKSLTICYQKVEFEWILNGNFTILQFKGNWITWQWK